MEWSDQRFQSLNCCNCHSSWSRMVLVSDAKKCCLLSQRSLPESWEIDPSFEDMTILFIQLENDNALLEVINQLPPTVQPIFTRNKQVSSKSGVTRVVTVTTAMFDSARSVSAGSSFPSILNDQNLVKFNRCCVGSPPSPLMLDLLVSCV